MFTCISVRTSLQMSMLMSTDTTMRLSMLSAPEAPCDPRLTALKSLCQDKLRPNASRRHVCADFGTLETATPVQVTALFSAIKERNNPVPAPVGCIAQTGQGNYACWDRGGPCSMGTNGFYKAAGL